ncbi:hypothetical protein [Streptomyces sp. NBC_00443]|uniref:hypothetical protein n=1 Tax=Streptomyces sp. NBC_00443 TaxID=2975743 RepID=UPI002E1BF401
MYPHYDTPAADVIAYTAGLLDAAGTIAPDGSEVTITRTASPDTADTVEWLAQVWQTGKTRTEGDRHTWQVTHPRAVEHLLTLCQPVMREQRQQATEARERVQATDSQRLPWTPGEDRWLLDHWHHHNAQIAEALGRTENAIPHRRRYLRPDLRTA